MKWLYGVEHRAVRVKRTCTAEFWISRRKGNLRISRAPEATPESRVRQRRATASSERLQSEDRNSNEGATFRLRNANEPPSLPSPFVFINAYTCIYTKQSDLLFVAARGRSEREKETMREGG